VATRDEWKREWLI